jgi:hypothetical protein
MRRCIVKILVGVLVCSTMLLAGIDRARAADAKEEVAAADHALVAALAKMDKTAAGKYLDRDFLWTNAQGATVGRSMVLGHLPKAPLGDESGAQMNERIFGRVGVVEISSGKTHILRVWVMRPAGWRALIYHVVVQRETPAPPPKYTTNICNNPCKGPAYMPYKPKDAAETGILTSWGQLETAVLHHNAKDWEPHFLPGFSLISSNATEPAVFARRVEQLNRPGIGPAPPELAAKPQLRFFHFGDSVVMVAQSKPYSGKPSHITRLWVLRDGIWRMAFSYQTTVEAARAAMPKKST